MSKEEIIELLYEKQRVNKGETRVVFGDLYMECLERKIEWHLDELKRERVVNSPVDDFVDDSVEEMDDSVEEINGVLEEWKRTYAGRKTRYEDVERLEGLLKRLQELEKSHGEKSGIRAVVSVRTMGATLAKMKRARRESAEGADTSLFAAKFGRYGGEKTRVALRDSGEARGRGVYAKEDIPARRIVTEVYGDRLTEEEMSKKRKERDPRVLYSVGGRYDDGDDFYVFGVNEPVEGEGLGSFVNDSKDTGLQENAKFIQTTDDKVYVKTTRNVKAGEEILCKYPKVYWIEEEKMRDRSES